MHDGDINNAHVIQMQCCDFITINDEYFSDFIESESVNVYVNKLRNPATFGDHIEIFCVSHLFAVNIWVYEKEATGKIKIRSTITSPDASPSDKPLKLLYIVHKLHYEPLIEKEMVGNMGGVADEILENIEEAVVNEIIENTRELQNEINERIQILMK